MNRGDWTYIWQNGDWPNWRFDRRALAQPVAAVSHAQGLLLGRLADVGTALRNQATLEALTEDVVKTCEIEGEQLGAAAVRSSVARRLHIDIGALAPQDRKVDGVVAMVLDATTNSRAPLSKERLFAWHKALFPREDPSCDSITIGDWRDDALGPMQVVSGRLGRQRVHFEAPPAAQLEGEMDCFFAWANRAADEPMLIKAGIAHLWFVTLQMVAHSAFTVYRRRSSVSVKLTMRFWSGLRSTRWT
jgi:Fic family protein